MNDNEILTAEFPEPEHTDGQLTPETSAEQFAPDLDALIERAVETTIEKLGNRIAEAEERGYRRAVDEARQRLDAAHAAEPSRTNFLASTRPDIWD